MKVRCLLVDDEPLAIKLLEKHLLQLSNFEVVATCSNAAKAYEVLRTMDIDLLFMDIRMPQLSGIDLLKTIRNPPPAILTTAYREFALDAYDLGVIDYLLKPISFERFIKAIDRFWKQQQPASVKVLPSEDPYLVIKSGNKYQRIPAAGIYYIESLKDYIKICMGEKEIVARYKISDLEAEISNRGFLRVHRSFIVNMQKVTAFSAAGIELGKYEIPVGISYRELARKALKLE